MKVKLDLCSDPSHFYFHFVDRHSLHMKMRKWEKKWEIEVKMENEKWKWEAATNLTFSGAFELWLFTSINMLAQQSEAQNRIQFI